jgi:hypothetical protein
MFLVTMKSGLDFLPVQGLKYIFLTRRSQNGITKLLYKIQRKYNRV